MKFQIAKECIALTILIPMLFHYLQISDSICQNVLIQIGALSVTYGGLNLMSFKKRLK